MSISGQGTLPLTSGFPMLESEYKYLVRSGFDPEGCVRLDITQAYLTSGGDNTVRIRKKIGPSGGSFILTVKGPKVGISSVEVELPMSEQTYDQLLPLCGQSIVKQRYLVPHMGYTWEVDVFGGSLTGLVVAEVEVRSPKDPCPPAPPSWSLFDVTTDKRYTNSNLSRLTSSEAKALVRKSIER